MQEEELETLVVQEDIHTLDRLLEQNGKMEMQKMELVDF